MKVLVSRADAVVALDAAGKALEVDEDDIEAEMDATDEPVADADDMLE